MLITVYVPTKNRKELLAQAVESVLSQTHRDLELIVVDDGSSDGTHEYLIERSRGDERMRFFRNEQSLGGPSARNTAITAAKGEFITGLDDDDSFHPDRLATFLSSWRQLEARGESPSCLYSQVVELHNGRAVGTTSKPRHAHYEDMFSANVVGNQIFAPKQHYVEAGLFRADLPAWQDLEFFMRVLKKFGPGVLVDHANYNFDNTPRVDRVSLKSEEKMRKAFSIVDEAHSEGIGRRTQKLYVQLFARLYGIRPGWPDYRRFVALGWWPAGLGQIVKASLRPR